MSLIQRFKNSSPKYLCEEDGYDVLCDVLKEDNVNQLIAEHFDDSEIPVYHPSGNPELESWKNVDGVDYLKFYFSNLFGIDWKQAYNSI